jgi:predicted ribosomally synthesized peptide with SipW-like signal peptide
MKKIILSLAIVGVVGAVVIGGTIAYFSDTETSTGNTFTAGTIDISVTNPSEWQYHLDDMKPGYVDYSNFTIKNTGTNPVNITKTVDGIITDDNDINEPECLAYGGNWDGNCSGGTIENDLQDVVTYDLSVVVKDEGGIEKWNQTLYNNNKTLAEIQAIGGMFLGMIPPNWTMEVTESYHMLDNANNNYQSDKMTFNITLTGEQLKGSVVLEDKDPSNWQILSGDSTMATLNYTMKADKFNFTLTGKSPVFSGEVALVVGYNSGTNPDTLVGYGTTDASGNITMADSSVELGKDLINAKVWLIPKNNWNGTQVVGWNMSQYLWETGLIDYYDTNN